MNIGGLYSYYHRRRLHKESDCEEWFLEISGKIPFVLLGIETNKKSLTGLVKSYKILTANAEVGWISGIEEYFEEVTQP